MDFAQRAALRQHAVDCGLNMTRADVVPLTDDDDAVGTTLAHDVLDPEYEDVILHSGTTLTHRLVAWLRTFGVDYVTIRV